MNKLVPSKHIKNVSATFVKTFASGQTNTQTWWQTLTRFLVLNINIKYGLSLVCTSSQHIINIVLK